MSSALIAGRPYAPATAKNRFGVRNESRCYWVYGNARKFQVVRAKADGSSGALSRRQCLQSSGVLGLGTLAHTKIARAIGTEVQDVAITKRVVLELGSCPDGFNQQRGLGESALCKDFQPLGNLVIGLYGNLVPITVGNFLLAVESGAYNGTLIHKIIPGEYIQAGKQGPARLGGVVMPDVLQKNTEVTSSKAFQLQHFYPGTVSLPLSVNDDDARVTGKPGYRNAEFLITIGPAPAPSLDGENIVFGQVIEGMSTITKLSEVPIFYPQERLQLMNTIARTIGDERAGKARASWGRPLKPVVIISGKVLQDPPSLD